jgi:hypothetical protein
VRVPIGGRKNVDGIDVTFGRAFKIWWSYAWRAILLMIPVMTSKMFGLWVFMMAFYIAAQVQAMRWMLKTKWSDFRLQAISER